MKYGPIICNPNSEEAKKLIGKKVVASDYYARISEISELMDWDPLSPIEGQLIKVSGTTIIPFLVKGSVSERAYTFIREVIEEQPKYRPYKERAELLMDIRERFQDTWRMTADQAVPVIWLEYKTNGNTYLVTAFKDDAIFVMGSWYHFLEAFHKFTYLDGSPFGKEAAR